MRTLRVWVAVLAALLWLAPTAPAAAPYVLFNNPGASGDFGCGTDSSGNFIPCDVVGTYRQSFQVSVPGGGATNYVVYLYFRNGPGDDWVKVLTVQNPIPNTMGYQFVFPGQIYTHIDWVSGNARATLAAAK